jgi:hypothetical protein
MFLREEARALQETPVFKEYQRLRQAGELRLARMVHLGVRQPRHFGRTKTLFQALMAAAVANFTLIAGKTGEMDPGRSAKKALDPLLSCCKTVAHATGHQRRHQMSSRPFLPSTMCALKPRSRPGF